MTKKIHLNWEMVPDDPIEAEKFLNEFNSRPDPTESDGLEDMSMEEIIKALDKEDGLIIIISEDS